MKTKLTVLILMNVPMRHIVVQTILSVSTTMEPILAKLVILVTSLLFLKEADKKETQKLVLASTLTNVQLILLFVPMVTASIQLARTRAIVMLVMSLQCPVAAIRIYEINCAPGGLSPLRFSPASAFAG